MKAVLLLEDGMKFEGDSFGAEGEAVGEVVFNTQVAGWQEILTEPSYRKQIIAFGYPHIGNYGINDRCKESENVHASAFICKEYSRIYSNWQAKGSLSDFMKKNNVIGIEGIDTRALVTHIRDYGEMRGVVSTKDCDKESLIKKVKAYKVPNLIEEIKSQLPISNNQVNPNFQISNQKTIIINLGVNNSTLSRFPGAQIFPYDFSAADVLAGNLEQVVISGGPGDPRILTGTIGEVKKLIGKVKLYGIQNGACVLALALGCSINKMKVGHHGVNYPVVDPKTGKGEISAQNHSYCVDKLSTNVEVVHTNLNDNTVEKFATKDGSCVGALYFPIDERGKLPTDYRYV